MLGRTKFRRTQILSSSTVLRNRNEFLLPFKRISSEMWPFLRRLHTWSDRFWAGKRTGRRSREDFFLVLDVWYPSAADRLISSRSRDSETSYTLCVWRCEKKSGYTKTGDTTEANEDRNVVKGDAGASLYLDSRKAKRCSRRSRSERATGSDWQRKVTQRLEDLRILKKDTLCRLLGLHRFDPIQTLEAAECATLRIGPGTPRNTQREQEVSAG